MVPLSIGGTPDDCIYPRYQILISTSSSPISIPLCVTITISTSRVF